MTIRKLMFLGLGVVLLGCLTLAIVTLTRSSAKCPYCHSSRVRSSGSTLVD